VARLYRDLDALCTQLCVGCSRALRSGVGRLCPQARDVFGMLVAFDLDLSGAREQPIRADPAHPSTSSRPCEIDGSCAGRWVPEPTLGAAR
jgi:hypothetical protein